MGGKCGPVIANIYIYIKERSWLDLYKPVIYRRFIDDIFIVTENDLKVNNFTNIFGELKLNIISNKEVQFLDLLISKDKYFDRLSFKLYTKPTATFQYLHFDSNHPNHIFKNIPKSLFIRLKRICTHYYDYLFFSRKLIIQLLNRGYQYKFLIQICLTIGNEKRDSFISYKNKTDIVNFSNSFKFIINFDINYINLKQDFYSISNNNKFLFSYKKFSYLNSTNDNFNNIFVNNCNYNYFFNKYVTKNCEDSNCKTCYFIYDINSIKLSNNFSIPILCNANCRSAGVVYILICIKCNIYYIGQTKRSFHKRFNEHLYNIYNFKLSQFNSEIAIHCNQKKHNLKNDLKYIIFKDNLHIDKIRLSCETDLIHIFISLNLKTINRIIPNLNYIEKLSFSN